MKILYIHGFGSRVDPQSEKYRALSSIGDVSAVAPDYSVAYSRNMLQLQAQTQNADLIVGTSMGGCMASRLAKVSRKPFVAINPVLFPRRTLHKYLGTGTDYYGKTYTITEETSASYPVFSVDVKGLILLDLGDEVIDAVETLACIGDSLPVIAFDAGSHRFAHIHESLDAIVSFFESAQGQSHQSYGSALVMAASSKPIKKPAIIHENTEQKDLCCPVCRRLLQELMPPDLLTEPADKRCCPHVSFIFIDAYGDPFDLDEYEFVSGEVIEWLNFKQQTFVDDDRSDERKSAMLLTCPMVSHVLIDKPRYPAPFYRVIWGIRD